MRKMRNWAVSVVLCCLLAFESVVHGAAGQSAAPGQSVNARPGEDRARWLADHGARREHQRRHATAVFGFESLLQVFADQRDIERFVETYTITREVSARWRHALTRAAQETEIENLFADIVEAQEAYEELAAEYRRLAEEADSRGAGLLGMVASLAANFVVSAIPGSGPVLGAAVGSGFNKAINGGSFGEVLFAMGLAAGASFVAQEVSEVILADAAPMTDRSAGPSKARLDLASAGATVAGFAVAQVGGEFERALFAVPSIALPTDAPAAASITRRWTTVEPAVADLYQSSANAFRQLSAGLLGAGAWPVASPGFDAFSGMPLASPPRTLSDRAWNARHLQGDFQSALGGDALLVVHRVQRQLERPIEAHRIRRDLTARARRGLDRAAREAEAINLSDDRDKVVEDYERLLAEYQRFLEEIENRGGPFGAVFSVVSSVVGTMLGGPFLGAALAGAVGTLATSGNIGEALVSAGFNAGAAYAYSVAVPTLRGALFTSVEGEPTSLDEFIDKEIAREIEEFYVEPVEPVSEPVGDDSSRPRAGAMRAAAGGGARSIPVAHLGVGETASLPPVQQPRVDEPPSTPVEQLIFEAGYDPPLAPAEARLAAEDFPMLASRGMRLPPFLRSRRRQQVPNNYSSGLQTRQNQVSRSSHRFRGTPPSPASPEQLLEQMQKNSRLGAAVRLSGELRKWIDRFSKLDSGNASFIERSRVQADYERWLKNDAWRRLIDEVPTGFVPLKLDHGDHPGSHPGFCCGHDPDGDGFDGPGSVIPRR